MGSTCAGSVIPMSSVGTHLGVLNSTLTSTAHAGSPIPLPPNPLPPDLYGEGIAELSAIPFAIHGLFASQRVIINGRSVEPSTVVTMQR